MASDESKLKVTEPPEPGWRARGALVVAFSAGLTLLIVMENALFSRVGSATPAAFLDLINVTKESHSSFGSNTVTVAIDGEMDREISEEWPLPFHTWERATLMAYCAGARVLYFDVGFTAKKKGENDYSRQRADELKAFAHTVAVLSGTPNPESTAAERQTKFNENCIPPEEGRSIRTRPDVMPIFVSPTPKGNTDPTLTTLAVSVARASDGSYLAATGNGPPSAAVAIFGAWCQLTPKEDQPPGCAKRKEPPDAFNIRDTITSDPLQADFSTVERGMDATSDNTPCFFRGTAKARSQEWHYGHMFQAASNAFSILNSAFWSGPLPNWETCPPLLNISWDEFAFSPNLAEALQSRIVIFGTVGLSGIHDLYDTTVHKALPGFMFHALATQSLLDDQISQPINREDFTAVLFFIVLFLTASEFATKAWLRKFDIPDHRRGVIVGLQTFLLCVGAGFLFRRVANWSEMSCFRVCLSILVALGLEGFDPTDTVLILLDKLRKALHKEKNDRLV